LNLISLFPTAVPSMSAVSTGQSCNAQKAATIASAFGEADQQSQRYYPANEDSLATSTDMLYKAIFKDDNECAHVEKVVEKMANSVRFDQESRGEWFTVNCGGGFCTGAIEICNGITCHRYTEFRNSPIRPCSGKVWLGGT
jgi:hypothetical protein